MHVGSRCCGAALWPVPLLCLYFYPGRTQEQSSPPRDWEWTLLPTLMYRWLQLRLADREERHGLTGRRSAVEKGHQASRTQCKTEGGGQFWSPQWPRDNKDRWRAWGEAAIFQSQVHKAAPGQALCAASHLRKPSRPGNQADVYGQASEQSWPLSSTFSTGHSTVTSRRADF